MESDARIIEIVGPGIDAGSEGQDHIASQESGVDPIAADTLMALLADLKECIRVGRSLRPGQELQAIRQRIVLYASCIDGIINPSADNDELAHARVSPAPKD